MNLDQKKPDFEKVVEQLREEFGRLRTGRASTSMVEDLSVDYYGALTPIKGLANITVPEPRQLVITPWDKNALLSLEKAIRDSGLGLNPTNEGDKLRISIPPLTEERRRELTKVVGKTAEEARIKLRSIREELWKEVKRQEEAKAISEDDRFRLQEQLQKFMDDYNQKIKSLAETKEKEIMTI